MKLKKSLCFFTMLAAYSAIAQEAAKEMTLEQSVQLAVTNSTTVLKAMKKGKK